MEATLSVSRQTGVGRFRMRGFSLLLHRARGEAVSSGPIIDVGDTQWEILVYPRGNDRCKEGWIRVSIRCAKATRETRAWYSVSVVSQAGEVKHGHQEEALFTSGDGWGFDNFASLERLAAWSKGSEEDVVIFEASVTVLGQEEIAVQPWSSQAARDCGAGSSASSPGADDLAADFGCLWESGAHSDVVLNVGDTELPAHRAVLAARSPVFARMLASDSKMAEAATGIIRIADLDVSTARHLCEYMYMGSINDASACWVDSEAAGALLQAAAKYDVRGLVRQCAEKIAALLSVDSVAEWLILASQLGPQAEALRSRCLHFIATHLSDVQCTEGWGRLMSNPRITAEVAPMLFQAISPPFKRRRKADRRLE